MDCLCNVKELVTVHCSLIVLSCGFVAGGLPTIVLVLAAELVATPTTLIPLGVSVLKIPVSPSVSKGGLFEGSSSIQLFFGHCTEVLGAVFLKLAFENSDFSRGLSCISMAFLRAIIMW